MLCWKQTSSAAAPLEGRYQKSRLATRAHPAISSCQSRQTPATHSTGGFTAGHTETTHLLRVQHMLSAGCRAGAAPPPAVGLRLASKWSPQDGGRAHGTPRRSHYCKNGGAVRVIQTETLQEKNALRHPLTRLVFVLFFSLY